MPRPFIAPALALALLGGAACAPVTDRDAGPAGAPAFTPMTWADLVSRPRPKATHPHLRYGFGIAQYGDLWLPDAPGPHPLVVLIHGGCWTKTVADLSIMDWAAEDLRRRGLAVWNIEYRGVDEAGGGYPGTFQDVAAAVDGVRALADPYGLRLDRVVVAGHSAGGHLALWVAARPRIAPGPLKAADPLKVSAVVDIAGLPDLERDRDSKGCGPGPVDAMAGPERPGGRFADTSPAHMLPLGVRQVVMVGRADATVPPEVSLAYAARAGAMGDKVDLRILPDAGHAEVIAPGSGAWDVIADRIVALATGAPT